MKTIWERFQNSRIDDAAATADIAHARSHDLERRVRVLEEEVDSLTLITMAMWELFGKANGLFLKDLEAKMAEIDLRDGQLDGKYRSTPKKCPQCNHALGERRKVCIYCGADVTSSPGLES